ncbi:single-stranded DNA-binding protein [Desulfallas thermosapovorans]|uniref:Single-stranded DNA-binding protein n=1 Tax=Desulfallas thermosapovorans DSM 6562 TaxID=1121431 RepID=A0A5S4ZUG6_9FIRM|nr:single-stranded DNA-binding protein [Desulfallas thermosapovorans]TYO96434.1 single-strand binding protein [Desulfallas thermosapovorans DSM 6562]
MLNKVILIGRLTRDPELRHTPSGMQVATFSLALNRQYTNRQGERVDGTDYIDIVVWQKLAETCANYLGKGRLVAVEGRLQSRSYDDKQGIRRKVVEVVASDVRFLDSARDARGPVMGGNQAAEGEHFASEISFNEEDIPF